MADLINNLINGKPVGSTYESDIVAADKKSELSKDDFLQLLVAQMKYQDPMQPETDTAYVAQLAQFSSLEQMQNLNRASVTSQAFSLVGRNVIVQDVSETGEVSYKNGYVDFVTMQNGKAFLSIEDKLYSVDQLHSVIDEFYVQQVKNAAEEEAKKKAEEEAGNGEPKEPAEPEEPTEPEEPVDPT